MFDFSETACQHEGIILSVGHSFSLIFDSKCRASH